MCSGVVPETRKNKTGKVHSTILPSASLTVRFMQDARLTECVTVIRVTFSSSFNSTSSSPSFSAVASSSAPVGSSAYYSLGLLINARTTAVR